MPIEIEAKMKVENFDQISAVLKAQGASSLGEHIETDTFFDTPDRTLLAADKGLRLRVALDVKTNKTEALLTYKGPVAHGELKKRQEIQTPLADPHAMAMLFEQLGFKQSLRYQKRRQSWQLDSCRIELDEIPHLGKFVEIEGFSDQAVMNVRQKLGLASSPLIKTSYIAMLSAHLHEKGQNVNEVLL